MKTKHTPGPWKYTPSTKGGTVMGKVECGDNTVFSVQSHMADGQADANARLIAAAPEMLAALEEIMQQSYNGMLPEVFNDAAKLKKLLNLCGNIASRAIDKAKGE